MDDLIANSEENLSVKYFVQKTNVQNKFEWMKNDKIIQIDNIKYISSFDENENSYSLQILRCEIKDASKYSLVVSNSYGKTKSDFRILFRCKLAMPH